MSDESLRELALRVGRDPDGIDAVLAILLRQATRKDVIESLNRLTVSVPLREDEIWVAVHQGNRSLETWGRIHICTVKELANAEARRVGTFVRDTYHGGISRPAVQRFHCGGAIAEASEAGDPFKLLEQGLQPCPGCCETLGTRGVVDGS